MKKMLLLFFTALYCFANFWFQRIFAAIIRNIKRMIVENIVLFLLKNGKCQTKRLARGLKRRLRVKKRGLLSATLS